MCINLWLAEVIPPFSMCIPHPYQVLSLRDLANESIAPYHGNLFLVHIDEVSNKHDTTVLDLLSDSQEVRFQCCQTAFILLHSV